MKLISEDVREIKFLYENDENGKKSLHFTGLFSSSNQINKNGRWYPPHVLEKAYKRVNEELIRRQKFVGELGHPEGAQINQERIALKVKHVRHNGRGDWYGKAAICHNLPCGKILEGLYNEGIPFGVSTRSIGSLKQLQHDSIASSTLDAPRGNMGVNWTSGSKQPRLGPMWPVTEQSGAVGGIGYDPGGNPLPLMEVEDDLHILAADAVHEPSVRGQALKYIKEHASLLLEDDRMGWYLKRELSCISPHDFRMARISDWISRHSQSKFRS